MDGDYGDILKNDLPEVEKAAEAALLASSKKQVPLGFENLLHPLIKRHCYKALLRRQFPRGRLQFDWCSLRLYSAPDQIE